MPTVLLTDSQPARQTPVVPGVSFELAALPAVPFEAPVFHDASGRRARLVKLGGGLLATACAVWVAILVAGCIGTATLPALSAPAAGHLTSGTVSHQLSVRQSHSGQTLVAREEVPSAHRVDLD